jgi:hypothetical protein
MRCPHQPIRWPLREIEQALERAKELGDGQGQGTAPSLEQRS